MDDSIESVQERSDVLVNNTNDTPLITQATSSSLKRKKRKRIPKAQQTSQFTIRNPPWQYMHLQRITSTGTAPSLDTITAHLHLTAALSQFLGLHGAAVAMDILKVEGADVWIRVPHEDGSAVIAAAGGWVSSKGEGWSVKGTSSWDARAFARDGGQDLFND